LAEWQLRYDRYPDLGLTTSDLLRIKAREFWDKLPCYARKEPPKFSDGWLVGFKRRYGLKERRRHGEGASAQINEESEQMMKEIRVVAREYRPDLTYNIDELAYY